ncbi:hypothetical protein ACLOJK_038945 [Asimina triloba]
MSVATQTGISTSSAAVVCTYMGTQPLLLIEHHGRLDRSLWAVAIEWFLTEWKEEAADVFITRFVRRSRQLMDFCWVAFGHGFKLWSSDRGWCGRRSLAGWIDLADGDCRPLARVRSLLPICDRMGFSTGKLLDLEFQIRNGSSMTDLELLIVAADDGSFMGRAWLELLKRVAHVACLNGARMVSAMEAPCEGDGAPNFGAPAAHVIWYTCSAYFVY